MKIPKYLIDKYVKSVTFVYNGETDKLSLLVTYQAFLDATDYICNKVIEGVATWEEYAEEKKYRQIARDEINKLR